MTDKEKEKFEKQMKRFLTNCERADRKHWAESCYCADCRILNQTTDDK